MIEINKAEQCPRALLLFVKNPIEGRVKTRLAAEVGDAKALDIYLRLLEHTRSVALALRSVEKYLYYSDYIDEEDAWPAPAFNKMLQAQVSDLGQRMQSAFEETMSKGNAKVVIIGSDCAQLSSKDIEDAFRALDTSDVVFGPALDGGYYLCGMKDTVKPIFDLKQWSTEHVLKESIDLCREAGLRVSLLRTLSDIDFSDDWKKHGLDL